MIQIKCDKSIGDDIPYALNLFFTGKCNLGCRYCFVDKTGLEQTTVDEFSLKKSVLMLFDYPGGRKTLSFNGGEPTLEFSLLTRIYDYARTEARKRGITLTVAVMTNGTLLDQRMVDFFTENKTVVKVSIDGAKLSHDKNRPFKAAPHASSFDRIVRNIDAVDRKDLRLAASLVFTPGNVDQFLDNVKFLNTKNFRLIEFYPDLYASWDENDLLRLKGTFKSFEAYYISLFQKGDTVFENSLLYTFVNEVEVNKMEHCGKIHLNAEREFYVCDKVFSLPASARRGYVVGNIESGIDDERRVSLLNSLRAEFREISGLECSGCKYLKYCFCPVGHYIYYSHYKNDIMHIDPRRFFKSFCCISKIYAESFLRIKDALKYNERFVALYQS